MVATVQIGKYQIGHQHPCFIIGEAGVNHNGDVKMALELVDAAVDAKVDAIKFQTFKTERVMTKAAPKAQYQLETTGDAGNQFDMVKRLELAPEDFVRISSYCAERNILFLSSPFDVPSVDLLAELGVDAFKVPSGEITNLPYLSHMASKGKPMIVSTGMANINEVATALNTIESSGHPYVVLLQCTSNYPADPANANLRAMLTMEAAFGVPVGYSDHTPGIQVPLAAVALGACVVEKHFTLDCGLPGPDHRASLEPRELTELVEGVRIVEASMGDGRKQPNASEANTAAVARKSLVAARDIHAGATITEDLVAIKRPGSGLPPSMLPHVVGRSLRVDIDEDTLFSLEMFA